MSDRNRSSTLSRVEIANPAGDGVRILLDLGLTLDFALRLVGSAMRLRRLIP
jgi:hypothetical protein